MIYTDIFGSIFSSEMTSGEFMICLVASIVIGIAFSLACMVKTKSSKGFHITVALMPVAVAMIILLVNGNIGVGVAIGGAFGLIRFRSAQGSAKEITIIFIAMAIGVTLGMGYVAYAVIFAVLAAAVLTALSFTPLFSEEGRPTDRTLKIVIPEDLDYTDCFDDLFGEFTKKHELLRVKSTHMGSMFTLTYSVTLKNKNDEKKMIDKLRERNGNLEIMMSKCDSAEEL